MMSRCFLFHRFLLTKIQELQGNPCRFWIQKMIMCPSHIESRSFTNGWVGKIGNKWDVYSYKHGGMFMGCGQLEYKLIKLSLFGFPNTVLVLPEVLCLILGKPEQSLKPYSTFNNFPPGIFPASFHHKPVHGFYKNCYISEN